MNQTIHRSAEAGIMYTIDKTDYGYATRFCGSMSGEEMCRWRVEILRLLADANKPFYLWTDGRELNALSPEALEEWNRGQSALRCQGLERSVVLLNDPSTTRRFCNKSEEACRRKWERCIDASSTPNWVQCGLDWIFKAIDHSLQGKPS